VDGGTDRELLWGDRVSVIERRGDMVFARSDKDGYVGWLDAFAVGQPVTPTHRISVRTTWAYGAPDFKTPIVLALHMTSRLRVEDSDGAWTTVTGPDGALFVPTRHILPVDQPQDMLDVARAFLGTPYVWAGNSGFGIDCSGLVQVAFHAAGRACAPDSDLQERMAGTHPGDDDQLQAGDLIFWKRHVALVTGPDSMIHANAHHMAVAEEPISEAVARIAAGDTGPVTSRLRPNVAALASG
jgi:cell wall-associated NlpC family hydrolase